MHRPHRHTGLLRRSDALQKILEHRALIGLHPETTGGVTIDVRTILAHVIDGLDSTDHIEETAHAHMIHGRSAQFDGKRRGDRQAGSRFPEPRHVLDRVGFGLHHRGVGPDGHAIPLIHQILWRVGQTEALDRVLRDVSESHGRHLGHIVVRNLDPTPSQEIHVDLVPYAHRIEKRPVKVEYGALTLVVRHRPIVAPHPGPAARAGSRGGPELTTGPGPAPCGHEPRHGRTQERHPRNVIQGRWNAEAAARDPSMPAIGRRKACGLSPRSGTPP